MWHANEAFRIQHLLTHALDVDDNSVAVFRHQFHEFFIIQESVFRGGLIDIVERNPFVISRHVFEKPNDGKKTPALGPTVDLETASSSAFRTCSASSFSQCESPVSPTADILKCAFKFLTRTDPNSDSSSTSCQRLKGRFSMILEDSTSPICGTPIN